MNCIYLCNIIIVFLFTRSSKQAYFFKDIFLHSRQFRLKIYVKFYSYPNMQLLIVWWWSIYVHWYNWWFTVCSCTIAFSRNLKAGSIICLEKLGRQRGMTINYSEFSLINCTPRWPGRRVLERGIAINTRRSMKGRNRFVTVRFENHAGGLFCSIV